MRQFNLYLKNLGENAGYDIIRHMNSSRRVNLTLGGREWQPRFIYRLDQQKCSQCCMCIKVCPSGVFRRTVKGTVEPSNRNACIGCGVCERMCSDKAITCQSLSEEQ